MPRTIRFHLDEHVPHAIANGLRRLGIDVTTSTETCLIEATDAAQLAYGLAHGRVIVTQDDDFLALAASGVPHAGLAYCAPSSRTIEIIGFLELIWEVYEPNEMIGRIEFL
jgi:predicted nuclease of predicted toxin-antitoxin system